jgi:hypothetical protein
VGIVFGGSFRAFVFGVIVFGGSFGGFAFGGFVLVKIPLKKPGAFCPLSIEFKLLVPLTGFGAGPSPLCSI